MGDISERNSFMPADSLASSRVSTVLIRDCTMLTHQESTHLLSHQDIFLVGSRIHAIGPTGTLHVHPDVVGTLLDGTQLLAMPGLINAHTHSPENLLKATSVSLPLELWLLPLFVGIPQTEWTPRLVYVSAMLGAIEMLKSGTTAVLDHLWTVDGVASAYINAAMQAYQDVGIRASVAPSIEDCDLVMQAGGAQGIVFPTHPFTDRFTSWPSLNVQLAEMEQVIAAWHQAADGRLICMPGPSGIHWCSPDLLDKCQALAEKYHTPMHLHAVETELQAAVIHRILGCGGIDFLNGQGVLRPGTSLAHAIWLEPHDVGTLALSGASVVHNPVSNMRLGSGLFPFTQAKRQGVTIALGCDGAASNDTQNMFGVLKLCGLLHNHSYDSYEQWPEAVEILDAATCGGAAALGLTDELGTLAPGQLADIVLLDLTSPAFFPLHDPYLHLVYCEQGESVDTVIVHGQVVVQHNVVKTVDEDALRKEARLLCKKLWPTGFLSQDVATQEVMKTFTALRRLLLSPSANVSTLF